LNCIRKGILKWIKFFEVATKHSRKEDHRPERVGRQQKHHFSGCRELQSVGLKKTLTFETKGGIKK